MSWNVPYINLGLQYIEDKQRIDEEFNRVMSNGSFILRDDVDIFEKKMAGILNVKHVIGVNSGTDALYLAVRALKIGVNDEVITVAHTFVATIAAIHHVGGAHTLIDINSDYNIDTSLIENAITEKTKAIMPVHMNGRMCNMDVIMRVAEKYNLVVIEDAAQALGAKYKESYSGSIGDIGCFSLHPMKILSCPGDGGFITTNSDILNNKLRLLRNHGQKTKTELSEYGYSSRLDNLHAAIVNIKLDRLVDKIDRRRIIARIYNDKLSKLPIRLPNAPEDVNTYYDVYNSYVIAI